MGTVEFDKRIYEHINSEGKKEYVYLRYLIKIKFHDILYKCDAGIAQSVEQLIRNQQVKGSSPFASSGFQKISGYRDFIDTLFVCEMYAKLKQHFFKLICCLFLHVW